MRELRYGTARARKILLTLRAYLVISVIFFLLFANFQQFGGERARPTRNRNRILLQSHFYPVSHVWSVMANHDCKNGWRIFYLYGYAWDCI